ncbi:MAG TPA: Kdo hydroxylase family protein [Vicinamibacterales bacterium]|jgi:3-deoxy-D-manno-oct-2-ulosonic acid (Kdo) hydroxylase|nr:Kdo hydroxylase family protein [Vicinamibacterales bacterium]
MSPCEKLIDLPQAEWGGAASSGVAARASAGIEAGQVLFLPELSFACEPREAALFTPAILGSAKNASFDPATGRLGGTNASGDDAELLRALMRRFSDAAAALVNTLLPDYRETIARGRASFRPAEIAGRASSWRKDDTRLHVDSFPATPTGGRRILRVFTNVNPNGKPRAWRVGGDFESVARRFANTLSIPLPGSGHVLALLRVTKSPRSAYDALMLQLHDRMKGDEDFQRGSPQAAIDFPAGSTWLAFTDEVSHAALAGQYQLEQTFLVPVAAMQCPDRSPLRVLERLKGQRLA